MIPDPAIPVHTERVPDDLVLFRHFAARRKVHVNTLHRQRQAADDRMPAWKILGRWYVSESEFAGWVARRSGRQAPAVTHAVTNRSAELRRRDAEAARQCELMGA